MLISVVVPVYNSEKYIERCIESVLNQKLNSWELILVDDGSTDSSLKILNNYAANDSRIVVIHQQNGGPGKARNTGIKYAKGEYLVFLDSDDFINPDYFELVAKKSEDVIFIDVNQLDESLQLLRTEYMSNYRSFNKNQLIRLQMTGKMEWGGVRKVVKRSIVNQYDIKYTNHKIGEEAIYSFFVLYYAKTFSFIEKPVYNYINRSGSQSDSKTDDPWGPVVSIMKAELIEKGIYKEYGNTLNAFLLTSVIVSLDRIASSYSLKGYIKKANKVLTNYYEHVDNNYNLDWESTSNKVKLMYPFIKLKIPVFVYFASKVKQMLKK